MYSFVTVSDIDNPNGPKLKEKHRAKGFQFAAQRVLRHADYSQQLDHPTINSLINRRIGARAHQIFSIETEKRALCSYDDKRYLLEDNITSLAYGHKDIPVGAIETIEEDFDDQTEVIVRPPRAEPVSDEEEQFELDDEEETNRNAREEDATTRGEHQTSILSRASQSSNQETRTSNLGVSDGATMKAKPSHLVISGPSRGGNAQVEKKKKKQHRWHGRKKVTEPRYPSGRRPPPGSAWGFDEPRHSDASARCFDDEMREPGQVNSFSAATTAESSWSDDDLSVCSLYIFHFVASRSFSINFL